MSIKTEFREPPKEAQERLKKLEPTHRGWVAAIELDTSEIFLGKTWLEALKKARKKYPKSLFFFVRIGYPAMDWHRGGLRKVQP